MKCKCEFMNRSRGQLAVFGSYFLFQRNNMISDSREHMDEEDENLYGMKKVLYWDIYGLKRFPYCGKRKRGACLQQTFQGQIVLHNDIFGLTIHQFEREFQACLERRRLNSQRILNVRFPDKASNQYLEYLENSDHNQECEARRCFSQQENDLYDNLVQLVGNEKDIRTRQRMFIVTDIISNSCKDAVTDISSGSLAEGFDLPGSDKDIMFIFNSINVIQDSQQINPNTRCTTLLVEYDYHYPGFSKLKVVAAADRVHFCVKFGCFVETGSGLYLSNKQFINSFKAKVPMYNLNRHGPCLTLNEYEDFAICLRMRNWPTKAKNWIYRDRYGQWPSKTTIVKIVQYGCLFVPISPKGEESKELLWRISFSVAEKELSHSLNYIQLLCYGLLKLTLKKIINSISEVNDLLCSYFLKTALFWLSEEIPINTFQISKFFHCFILCLEKIISWVKLCYCPNYFIPEHNMFKGKINRSNNQLLLRILDGIKHEGPGGLLRNIFADRKISTFLDLDKSSVKLEFLFYRFTTGTSIYLENVEKGYKTLRLIKQFVVSESSQFMSGVHNCLHAIVNQLIAQRLPRLTHKRESDAIMKKYQRHLQNGIKSDAVSGWLLYASFYYVLGKYKTALKIIYYVISRFAPEMLIIGSIWFNEDQEENYRHKTNCQNLTLTDKMRLLTMFNVHFMQRSSLIPNELELEVQSGSLPVLPPVMAHCLRFLCYHHLGDIYNRQLALRDLDLIVNDMYILK